MFDQKSGLSQLPIMIEKQFKCLGDVPYVPEDIPGTFLDGLLGVVLLVVAQPPQPASF